MPVTSQWAVVVKDTQGAEYVVLESRVADALVVGREAVLAGCSARIMEVLDPGEEVWSHTCLGPAYQVPAEAGA